MQSTIRHAVTFAVFCAVAGLAGCGTTTPTRSDTTEQVVRAQQTIANFANDPEMKWFRENLNKARAVIISPRVTRAAFVFGGSGGEALVLARDKSGRWIGPAFYNLAAGGVGFQLGVDVSEVVILVMSEQALNGLLSRSFKLGGDATITAGPVGVGAAATVTADMVSFARSKGAYVGVSLDGTVLAPDDAANQAFYGKPVTPVDILVRATVKNPDAAPLQQALARITK